MSSRFSTLARIVLDATRVALLDIREERIRAPVLVLEPAVTRLRLDDGLGIHAHERARRLLPDADIALPGMKLRVEQPRGITSPRRR